MSLQVVRPERINVIAIRELSQREVAANDQTYSFDNRKSRSTAIENIRVSQRLAVSVVIMHEKLITALGELGFTLLGMGGVQGKLSKAVTDKYEITTASELTFGQDTTINIPAHTHVKVIIHWKKIWQDGAIRLTAAGHSFEVPYGVTVALRFDKETVDVT